MSILDIKKVLADHLRWVKNGTGTCADLRGADLRGADLGGADLRWADLGGANLSEADLSGANLGWVDLRGANLRRANLGGANLGWVDLRRANLSGADLSGADLRRANLGGADLSGANLHRANLSGANLSWADLSEADLSGADLRWADLRWARNIPALTAAQTLIVPQEGTITGWKKCRDGVIIKLEVPAGAKRHNATGRKCRAERVVVVDIFGADVGVSDYDYGVTRYVKGETVVAPNYNPDRWNECGGGIHFYITREEAEAHA